MVTKFEKPTGELNARIHGAIKTMERRAGNARRDAAHGHISIEAQAALRGKAKAYDEAAVILRALEHGRPLDRQRRTRRWKWWR